MICIAGKNDIAVFGLKLLLKKGVPTHRIVAVTNKNDDSTHGWQPSFKKICNEKNIKIVELEELYDQEDLVFISLEFDQIIRPEKFKSKKLFNIHFSLLPAYKGMFTSIWPILKGEKHSGVTLHKIDNGIDTGDIIDQYQFDLPFQTTGLKLYNEYIYHSKELLTKNIDKLLKDSIQVSTKQPMQGASYYSKHTIDFNSVDIDFKKTCFQVCNFINAFSFRPYQLLNFEGQKICRAYASDIKSLTKPGTIIKEDSFSFEITTIDYNILLLKDHLSKILDASKNNDLEKIMAYHKKGFDFNEKNQNGWDVLIVACYNNALEIVNYLIQNKLYDINSKNNNGTSAVMYAMTNASKTYDLRCLTLLIENGADLKQKDYKGNDVFHYAHLYKNKKVIEFLSNLV